MSLDCSSRCVLSRCDVFASVCVRVVSDKHMGLFLRICIDNKVARSLRNRPVTCLDWRNKLVLLTIFVGMIDFIDGSLKITDVKICK